MDAAPFNETGFRSRPLGSARPGFGYWPQITQISVKSSESYRDFAIYPLGEGCCADKHLVFGVYLLCVHLRLDCPFQVQGQVRQPSR